MTRNALWSAAAAGALGGMLLVAAWQGSVFGILLLGLVFSSAAADDFDGASVFGLAAYAGGSGRRRGGGDAGT